MTTEEPFELELIRSAIATDVKVTKTEKKPTSADDTWLRIEGRLGDEDEDDVEWAATGFIFAVSAFSFADARPRGTLTCTSTTMTNGPRSMRCAEFASFGASCTSPLTMSAGVA